MDKKMVMVLALFWTSGFILFTTTCQLGSSGPHCGNVQSCQGRPCQNGGTCFISSSSPLQYSCRCPAHFSGRHCEHEALALRTRAPACPYPECEQRSGDKVCDPQCNSHQCQWDGGDCSLHLERPWVNCTAHVPCWELFRNGRCDKDCDNAGCLFDSFECHDGQQTCTYEKYCKDHYGNGVCDQSCNTEACGWDGLDCSGDTPPKLVDGTLVVVVLLRPEQLLRDMRNFLRSLGTLLHTNLRVKLDHDERPMVYPYYGLDGKMMDAQAQRDTGKRELEKDVIR